MNLQIKTKNGFIQELRDIELISVDGVPYDESRHPDLGNLQDRICQLERMLISVTNFLDERFELVPADSSGTNPEDIVTYLPIVD